MRKEKKKREKKRREEIRREEKRIKGRRGFNSAPPLFECSRLKKRASPSYELQ